MRYLSTKASFHACYIKRLMNIQYAPKTSLTHLTFPYWRWFISLTVTIAISLLIFYSDHHTNISLKSKSSKVDYCKYDIKYVIYVWETWNEDVIHDVEPVESVGNKHWNLPMIWVRIEKLSNHWTRKAFTIITWCKDSKSEMCKSTFTQ